MLNTKMIEILNLNPPPSERAKYKIKYVAQVSSEPNVIALYLNYPSLIKTSKRYLENSIRKNFDLKGVSIKFRFERNSEF